MRRTLLALASLFVLTTAGVCDSTDTTSPDGNGIVGTYTLVSVNGQTLPATFEQSTITGGSVVITASNTFTYTESRSGQANHVTSGTWSQSGSTYTFHPTSAGDNTDATGTLSGSQLTIDATDELLVFNKQ
jgi:hypothetical protein